MVRASSWVVWEIKTHLLAEANPRSCVEGTENERVGSQVFVHALVEETIWVKLHGCGL